MVCRPHRWLVAAVLVLGLAGAAPPPANAEAAGPFVSNLEDLPLMPGLSEDVDAAMAFDTPSGRIVEAYASGPTTPARVLEFYAATLPQLGWQREGEAAFRREGEILRLEFSIGPSRVTVRFALSPESAGATMPPTKP